MDKNKIIQAATKYVQKGQFDKAIREYQRLLEEDPRDIRILLKIGELFQKRGNNREAAASLLKVAETYSNDGFFLKAAAVYKQVLKLNPGLIEVNLRLADLYQQLGLLSDATQQYQTVAAIYEKQGNVRGSLSLLKKLVELEPDNAASRVRLGEAYSHEGMTQEALAELSTVAEQLKQANRMDEYLKVAERLLFLNPTHLGLARELARQYLSRGDVKRSLTKLQVCFKANPRDLETLQLLAQAFSELGQPTKTISVYKELAKIYGEQGNVQEEMGSWRKVLDLSPDDPEAQGGLGLRMGPVAVQPLPLEEAAPTEIQIVRQPAPPSVPAETNESLEKLLGETDVYLKYGLYEKATEHLQQIFKLAPHHRGGHEKARELHLATGDLDRAADELAVCIGLALDQGDQATAELDFEQLVESAPDHPQIGVLQERLGGAPASEAAPAPPFSLEQADAVLERGPEAENTRVIPLTNPLPPPELREDPEPPEEVLLTEESPSEDEVLLLQDEGFSEVAPEEDDLEPSHEEIDPEQVQLLDEGTEADAMALAAAEAGEAPLEEDSAQEPTALQLASPTASDDDRAEVEFFLQQGLVEEAREALESLEARLGEQPELRHTLEALEHQQLAAVSPPHDGLQDLATELAAEVSGGPESPPSLDEFQYSAQDVLSEFKKGVERTVRPEDVETHYDLGIAYREMGLIDEAIAEFDLALRGATGKPKGADCLAMIGLCRASQGNNAAAAEDFERALAIEGLRPEAKLNLHFEIGSAREAAGDWVRALTAYEWVANANPSYRSVDAALARVRAQQTAANSPGRGKGSGESGKGDLKKKSKIGYI